MGIVSRLEIDLGIAHIDGPCGFRLQFPERLKYQVRSRLFSQSRTFSEGCLLYTSDAADEL